MKVMNYTLQDAVSVDFSNELHHVHLAITGKSWELVRQHFPQVIPMVSNTSLDFI